MRSFLKLLAVIIVFSVFFFALRLYGHYVGYDVSLLVSDLGGLTYLYSTVGAIFAVFAAFIIVSESQDWNTLVAASKDEARALNELLLWSKKLGPALADDFSKTIKRYLEIVITTEWQSLKKGIESPEAEPILSHFHDLLAAADNENSETSAHLFSAFNDLLNHRAARIEYSWQPLPMILKFTIILVAAAVIGLSLFIGVKNVWLDYIFMLCIVTLVTVILVVIDDLDNPLRPGEWCLTSTQYERLLCNIQHFRRITRMPDKALRREL